MNITITEEKREEIRGVLGFGRYAMSKWRDIPRDYLEYLVKDDCRTAEENKVKARTELRNRDLEPGQMRFL